jgi:hypothetical protein
LLAKLLTESYAANSLVRDNYPALAHNPANITVDPEFEALNPGLPQYTSMEAAATISALSSDADLTWALTSYINADKEARAWLNGTPDPWGMTVNPNYLGISLPVESWPLLDNFTLPQSYIDSDINPCYSYSPAPYLQLIANPSSLLATIVQDVQFAVSNVDIDCPGGIPGDVATLRLQVQGRQPIGHRFVLGITSLSAARRYDLDTAALQTSLPDPDLSAKFASATGRQFAAPDDAALRAAAALMRPDPAQHTWTLDSAKVGHTAGAYPGTVPVYADVPTTGLPTSTAAHLATFLTYAAKAGEQPGTANGELPAGYLPLTAANGLTRYADYAGRAAAAVAAQRGVVPPLDAPPVTPGRPGSGTPQGSPAAGPPAGASIAPATPAAAPSHAATADAATAGAAVAGTIGVRAASATSRLGSWLLPTVLLLGALSALAGPALRYPGRMRAALRATVRVTRRAVRR